MEEQPTAKKQKIGEATEYFITDPVAFFFADSNLVKGCLLPRLDVSGLQGLSCVNRRLKGLLYDHYDLLFRRMWTFRGFRAPLEHEPFRKALYQFYRQPGREPFRFIRFLVTPAVLSEVILKVLTDGEADAVGWFLSQEYPERRMANYYRYLKAATGSYTGFDLSGVSMTQTCRCVLAVIDFATRDKMTWENRGLGWVPGIVRAIRRLYHHAADVYLLALHPLPREEGRASDITKFIWWVKKVWFPIDAIAVLSDQEESDHQEEEEEEEEEAHDNLYD